MTTPTPNEAAELAKVLREELADEKRVQRKEHRATMAPFTENLLERCLAFVERAAAQPRLVPYNISEQTVIYASDDPATAAAALTAAQPPAPEPKVCERVCGVCGAGVDDNCRYDEVRGFAKPAPEPSADAKRLVERIDAAERHGSHQHPGDVATCVYPRRHPGAREGDREVKKKRTKAKPANIRARLHKRVIDLQREHTRIGHNCDMCRVYASVLAQIEKP